MSKDIISLIAGCLVLLTVTNRGDSQDPGLRSVRLMFYNVENLFDIKDDSLKEDNDFLRKLCYTNGIEVPEEPCGYEYLPGEEFLYEQK